MIISRLKDSKNVIYNFGHNILDFLRILANFWHYKRTKSILNKYRQSLEIYHMDLNLSFHGISINNSVVLNSLLPRFFDQIRIFILLDFLVEIQAFPPHV